MTTSAELQQAQLVARVHDSEGCLLRVPLQPGVARCNRQPSRVLVWPVSTAC